MLSIFSNELVLTELLSQGIWAVMYVTLFVYTLRESRRQQDVAKDRENRLREEYNELRQESRKRENSLMDFINEISKQYERIATGVERLTMDVDEIKDELKLRDELRKRNNEGGER